MAILPSPPSYTTIIDDPPTIPQILASEWPSHPSSKTNTVNRPPIIPRIQILMTLHTPSNKIIYGSLTVPVIRLLMTFPQTQLLFMALPLSLEYDFMTLPRSNKTPMKSSWTSHYPSNRNLDTSNPLSNTTTLHGPPSILRIQILITVPPTLEHKPLFIALPLFLEYDTLWSSHPPLARPLLTIPPTTLKTNLDDSPTIPWTWPDL